MDTTAANAWQRLKSLLDRALELDADARAGYLASLEGDDASLRAELSRLLFEHERLRVRQGVRVVSDAEQCQDDGEPERRPRDAVHEGAAHRGILRSRPA